MWKFLFLVFFLSVDAQRLKFRESVREGVEITPLANLQDESFPISYRLPNNTQPELYLINLNLGDFHKDDLSFSGNVLISIRVVENTDTIVLHSSVSVIDDRIRLTTIENVAINYEVDYDTVREFMILKIENELEKGSLVRLYVEFTGTIGSSVAGIYRGSYLTKDDERRYFVATHMQPTFFRRVCPGYDEPQFKAFFSLVLSYNSGFKAISNMPEESTITDDSGRLITVFNQTPLMPTYLIAFVVSDFAENKKTSPNDILFRIFSRPEEIKNTEFGLTTAIEALELYENAFETKYELKKLDQVALPVFNRGGMENYGIVFYREDYLLYEPSVTTAFDKEFAAATIVHEVCHKFLGNLITPSFWSVLWLSEGFCRFYEYYMTENIYPTMRMEELFSVEAMQSILYRDSSLSTRPMTWYEETPRGVAGLFDGIAYSKSGSVIGMFLHSLSEKTFHKGLKIYLSKTTSNPEGVAVPENLYAALQKAIDEDKALPENYKIDEIFGSWENNAGYPIVYVERSYNDYRIRFSQNRFTDSIADGIVYDSLWHIPITYFSKVDPNTETKPKFWLNQRQMEVTVDEVKPNSFFVVNTKQTGYYRVMYDDANWMLIANELSYGNFSLIPPNSRAMLIDDAAVFFETKILKIRFLLEIVKYLEHDIDYIPWISATNNLAYMRSMLNDGNSKLSNDFQRFLRVLLAKTFNAFGVEAIENEPHYHKHIRNIAINWACQAHLESCITEARDKFNLFIKDQSVKFTSDHESAIYCNGLLNATEQEFNFMWNLYNNSRNSVDRRFYLRSIGCIENEDILKTFIMSILETPETVNGNSEWLTIIQAVYANGPIGLNVSLKFLRENIDDFLGFLKEINSLSSLNSIFRGIGNRINTRNQFKEIKDLMYFYDISSTVLEEIEGNIEENLEWIEKYSGEIQEFLDDFFNAASFVDISSLLIMISTFVSFLVKV